jgi:hypothetical protein
MLAGAFGVLLAAGCSDSTGSPLPVVILTNTWQEEGNAEHTFSITDDTDGVAQSSGTFTGTETLPNFTDYDLSGSWRNGRVTLTLERTPAVTWRADIEEDNTDRLVFTSSAGTLVIVRNVF